MTVGSAAGSVTGVSSRSSTWQRQRRSLKALDDFDRVTLIRADPQHLRAAERIGLRAELVALLVVRLDELAKLVDGEAL